MAKKKTTNKLQSIIKLKDNRVVIYYNNSTYKTGITLSKDVDGEIISGQFKDGYLTKKWGIDYEKANEGIYQIKKTIDDLVLEAKLNNAGGDVNNYIRAYLDHKQATTDINTELHLLSISKLYEVYVTYIKEKFKHRKKQTGIQKFIDIQKRISEFEETRKKQLNNIQGLNLKWRNNFAEFLASERRETITVTDYRGDHEVEKVRGCTNSTINGVIFNLLTFFKWIQTNYDVKLRKEIFIFEKYPERIPEDNIITFNKKQWEAFKVYEPVSKAERQAYDLFLFACFTGMRYSDCVTAWYGNRKKTEDENEYVILKEAEKTGRFFEVKLNPIALAIFKKYNEDFRDKFAKNQQVNKILRKIMKKIPSFCVKQDYKTFKLNKEVVTKEWFYDLVGFHCARKMLTTFLISQDYTLDEIFKITGWSDQRMLTIYMNKFNDLKKTKDIMF